MPRALLCVAALAAAADGLSWLLDGFRSDAPSHDATTQAIALRSALRDAGYTAPNLRRRLLRGTPAADALLPTALLRRDGGRGAAPAGGDGLDALTALFALGLPVDARKLPAACVEAVAPVCVEAGGLLRSRAMLAPVDARGRDLLVATDWPPEHGACRAGGEEACMYLGPDSAALADLGAAVAAAAAPKRVVDLCAGSGVQGLAAAAAGARATWVEREPRAAAFCRWNAAANGAPGDVRVGAVADADAAGGADLVLANPPYVAAPPTANYGAFADGGPDGYDVVVDCAAFAARALSDDGVFVVVLELNGPADALFDRVSRAWGDRGGAAALLHDAPSARTAAAAAADRRAAGDPAWAANYAANGVDHVANAVLVVRRAPGGGGLRCAATAVPRGAWAPPPTNGAARAWLAGVLRRECA